MLILGIESSCDETSVALVEDGKKIRSNRVATQIPIHARYGGVVPELASRNHVVELVPVMRDALSLSGATLRDVDAIAVAAGPGLVGSLLVGVELAKSVAMSLDVPLVGVNHIEAHLMAPLMEYEGPPGISGTPEGPFLGLVVSGGHTHLFEVGGLGRYKLIGATRDDAAGEAFDKVAKTLGLPYPGGVLIDRASKQGDRKAIQFPRSLKNDDSHDFSFSGLKTAVLHHVQRAGGAIAHDSQAFYDLCASFQEAVVDVLTYKLFRAARELGFKDVVISGGVSANSRLRERALEVATSHGVRVHIPPLSLCTDNAGMIAGLGYHYAAPLQGTGFRQHTLHASSSLPMGALAE
jgi:N6-L-threonylcarbamoyladenine synthase